MMKTTTEYREQFEALVQRAEQEMAAQPQAYRRRLQLLAWLGYGIMFGLLLLLLLVMGATLWAAVASSTILILLLQKKLIIVLGLLIWTLARSLFIPLKPPSGYDLTRQDYPVLWEIVDNLSQQLKTPPIHHILLATDLNAAIVQTPRLGVFGLYQNTLILGLELLMALSAHQARAVLAHELAHLSGNHSQFAAWIYRLRLSLGSINQAFHQTNAWGTGIMRRFMHWYAPYFTGYSYVLARSNEYEADAIAGQLTSPEITASALIATHVYGDLTAKQFWQPLYRKAYLQAQPETNVYGQLQRFLQQKETYSSEFYQCLRHALTQKVKSGDTHPPLMQRLKALKATGLKVRAPEASAMDWLGHQTETVLRHFNQQWLAQNAEQWEAFYQRARTARQEVEALVAQPYAALSPQARWRMAALTDDYLPEVDALPLFQQYAALYPDDIQAALAIGCILLERDNAEGIPYVEHAMENPAYQKQAAELAWRYYSRQRQAPLAELWLRRLEAATDMFEAARVERESLQLTDTIVTASAPSEAIEQCLCERFAEHKKVTAIWLAQKQVRYFPEDPVWVVAIQTPWWVWGGAHLQAELLQLAALPASGFIITDKDSKKIVKQVMQVGRRVE